MEIEGRDELAIGFLALFSGLAILILPGTTQSQPLFSPSRLRLRGTLRRNVEVPKANEPSRNLVTPNVALSLRLSVT
jgi:hypothetical protein